MKKYILIVLAALIPLCIFSQERVFKQLAKLPGVNSVYMGSGLMSMMSEVPISGYGLYNDYVKSLSQLETITADSGTKDIEGVRRTAFQIIDRMGLETLLETHEDDEANYIYVGKPVENEYIDTMVIFNDEGDELSIVYIKGRIHLPTLISRYAYLSTTGH